MNPNYTPPPELMRLVSDLFDRKLEETSRQRLQQLLLKDDAACEWYIGLMQVHSFLYLDGLNQVLSVPPLMTHAKIKPLTIRRDELADDPQPRNSLFRGRDWRFFMGAVAVVLMLVAIWAHSPKQPASAPPMRGVPIATLTKSIGGRFEYGSEGQVTPAQGSVIREGSYLLSEGLIELTYDSGVELIVMAPAEFSLLDEMNVELIDGRAVANVTKAGIGFTILTAGCRAVDLGTSFGVSAHKGAESEVHVLKGEVRIDTPDAEDGGDPDPMVLNSKSSQSAVKLYSQSSVPAAAGIDAESRDFVRSLDEKDDRYSQAVKELGPVVYYRMNPSGDGTKLIDSSVSGADAQIFQLDGNRPRWSGGKLGSAFEMGGLTDRVYAVANDYPKATGNQLSVIAWVYARSRPKYASIAKNWGHGKRGQFHFGLRGSFGELEIEVFEPGDPDEDHIAKRGFLVSEDVALPLHSWQFVAAVADGAMLRLYRNSREVANRPYDSLGFNPEVKALAIGTKLRDEGDIPYATNWSMWDGAIDELAIFNRSLSPEQISYLYEISKDGF